MSQVEDPVKAETWSLGSYDPLCQIVFDRELYNLLDNDKPWVRPSTVVDGNIFLRLRRL